MCGTRKFRQWGPAFFFSFLLINLLNRGLYGPPALQEACSRSGSEPIFLRKRLATCDFPGGGGPAVPPLDPRMCDLSTAVYSLGKDLVSKINI